MHRGCILLLYVHLGHSLLMDVGVLTALCKTNVAEAEKRHSPVNYKSKVWEHYGFYKEHWELVESDEIC